MDTRVIAVSTPVGKFNMNLDDKDMVIRSYFGEPKQDIGMQITDHSYISAVRDYFAGKPDALQIIKYRQGGTEFQQSVWRAMSQIPYGETASYTDVAAQIGRPKATRAVGSACARNSLPLIIPCHRVIKSDGNIGNYAFGTGIKQSLLKFESA